MAPLHPPVIDGSARHSADELDRDGEGSFQVRH